MVDFGGNDWHKQRLRLEAEISRQAGGDPLGIIAVAGERIEMMRLAWRGEITKIAAEEFLPGQSDQSAAVRSLAYACAALRVLRREGLAGIIQARSRTVPSETVVFDKEQARAAMASGQSPEMRVWVVQPIPNLNQYQREPTLNEMLQNAAKGRKTLTFEIVDCFEGGVWKELPAIDQKAYAYLAVAYATRIALAAGRAAGWIVGDELNGPPRNCGEER